ncbi:MAG TPA: VOC family protein, partial [Candidatus Binatus sp.]|nr:VOC family protein [Candidatus Binatus sp.]
KVFGAKEFVKERQSSPDGKILHGRILIGDSIVMMSDSYSTNPQKDSVEPGDTPVTLHIYAKDVDDLWKRAVDAGAKVVMPLDNMFWGERYGQLRDPFGHSWSVSMVIQMSPEEMEQKRQQAMPTFSQNQNPGGSE